MERRSEVTWGWPKPRERQGHGVARVIARVTTRLGVWEGHIQGEVPQELVSDAKVGLDRPRDLGRKDQRVLESYVHGNRACVVRGGAVGNMPEWVTRWPLTLLFSSGAH